MVKKAKKIRKALLRDAGGIRNLVNRYSEKGWMLPRSLSDIYESIRSFWVVESRRRVVGCVALEICWEDKAEIRSLAVSGEQRNKGWGRVLVGKCLREASRLGIKQVFTLTFLPEFFQKLGFVEIEKEKLPHKIWKDCLDCPHFPECKEVAMEYRL